MRKALLLSLGILLCANLAFGQAGGIALFSDAAFTSMTLSDVAPGLAHVYAVHVLTPGATASQWMLVNNGMLCSYIAESSPFITIGTAFTGISVAYGACLPSNILLLDITYYCQGLTPEGVCARIDVVPDPAAPTGTIEIVDCGANKLVGSGGSLIVNDFYFNCTVPAQETNWGKLKALYR